MTDYDDTSRLRVIAPLIAVLPASLRRRLTFGAAWALALAIGAAAAGAWRNSVNTSKDVEGLKTSMGRMETAVQGFTTIATTQATLAANQARDEQELQALSEWHWQTTQKAEIVNPYVTRKRK